MTSWTRCWSPCGDQPPTWDYTLLLELLRETREQAGVTQVELSRRLGITQSALSKYERGELRLDVVQVRNWCQALKTPFITLLAEFDKRCR